VTAQGRTHNTAVLHRFMGALLAGVLVFAPASPAFAWGNRANLFGTHDWALAHAIGLAESRGVGWVDTKTALLASDDPDFVFADYYYHAYDIWGARYGDAPAMVADRYTDLVRALRSNDTTAASKAVGWMSHYYADLGQPLHTDDSAKEALVHGRYEYWLAREMTTVAAKPGWVTDDGDAYVSDPQKAAVQLAVKSHGLYSSLMNGYLLGSISSPRVQALSATTLDRTVNGLADLISSATADAGLESSLTPLPAAVLTRPAVIGTPRNGRPFSLNGVLRSRHEAGTRAVTLYCNRYIGASNVGIRQWAPTKTVMATVNDSGETYSAYKVAVTLYGKGRWRIRAVHSDDDHRWSRSAYVYLTVK